MDDLNQLARRASQRLLDSHAVRALGAAERKALAHHVARIDAVLGGDPYAAGLTTTEDMQRALGGTGSSAGSSDGAASKPPVAPPPPPAAMTQVIGARSAEQLQAVDFPGFVASLVTG